MKETDALYFENLKVILKNIRNPETLDNHPWVQGLIVEEILASNPQLKLLSPGQQLVTAIAGLFSSMQPPAPPRRGKRLDPRWGEFGLLASLYFTPFNHGTPYPTSFFEAWERIDAAIFYHVYGKTVEVLTEEQIQKYQLVGGEVEFGSSSTLSDWHKKGLQRLLGIVLDRERYLSTTTLKPSVILGGNGHLIDSSERIVRNSLQRKKRFLWLAFILLLVALFTWGGLKVRKMYDQAMTVYEDASNLKKLVGTQLEITDLDLAGSSLDTLEGDLTELKQEVEPFLWLGPRLHWLPTYGGDLVAAPDLIELTEHLVAASEISLEAARPILSEINSRNSALDISGLTELLVQAQPQLETARLELDQARIARENINAEDLSPRLQDLVLNEIDPLLGLADNGLSLAMGLPGVLGATQEGPKTYLLLVQNEDELRPTGGFITSVGNLVISNGRVISMDFEDAGEFEDWSKPYPAAPWQLQQYMNSRVLVLRDSNWFVNFPTAAKWAEYLYAYTHAHSVDGVIAFDQHFLVMLLGKIGPLNVEGASEPLTSENVIDFMRQAKEPPEGAPIPDGWYRKEFIGNIAKAVLTVFTEGQNNDWRGVIQVASQALDERHLLLQMDEPKVSAIITKQNWDGAVRPGNGDFLMVTDTNIGFNKTNAVVDTQISYDVDLTNMEAPVGTLLVNHTNHASEGVPCIQWGAGEITDEKYYPIDRCYWDYLRVYKQLGNELLDASPHAVSGSWMLLGQGVPARVDVLDEGIQEVMGFGTLFVVPGGHTVNTSFTFALPNSVLAPAGISGQWIYHLKVQKQPGTLAIPLVLRVHLPSHASLQSVPEDAILQDNHLLVNSDLRNDFEIDLVYNLP